MRAWRITLTVGARNSCQVSGAYKAVHCSQATILPYANLATLSIFAEHKQLSGAGKLALELHPRALEYVVARVQSFEELQALKTNSPMEYFKSAFNNIGEFKRLEKLQHVLQRVKRLCVVATVYKCRCRCHDLQIVP